MSKDEIFLARDDEQDRLRGVLRQILDGPARAGHGYLMLVHGLGGIGKSTLLKRYRRMIRGELPDDRSFGGKFLLAKVNWEELRRVNPGMYPPGGPSLWRAFDDIYRAITDAAIASSKGASRQADRAFERFRELAAKSKDDHFTIEQATPGLDIAEAAIGQLANIGSLLPVPYAKQGADAIKQVTTTTADLTRKVRRERISPDQFTELVRPDIALVDAFAHGLSELSSKRPVVLSLDTCELLGEVLILLCYVIDHCGSKVLWMVAMRLEDDDRARSDSTIGPFLNQMPSSQARLVIPNRFTSRDVGDYIRSTEENLKSLGKSLPPGVTPSSVHRVTHGIPLAVQLVVESLKAGMPPSEALSEVTSSGEVSMVVRGLAERYLIHVKGDRSGDQNPDLALIHGLALLEGTRDPGVLAALWDIGPEQVSDVKDALRHRHDFVLEGPPWLHEEVRDVIRRFLLDPDERARVRAANERATKVLRQRLSELGLDTVEAQLGSDQWCATAAALLWHTLWTDDRQGVALLIHLLPAAMVIGPGFGRQLLRTTSWFTAVFPDELRSLTAGLQALATVSSFLLRLRDMFDSAAGHRVGTALWRGQTLAALERGSRYPDGVLAKDVTADALLDLMRAGYPRTFGVKDTQRFELLVKADAAVPAATCPPGALSQFICHIAMDIAQQCSQATQIRSQSEPALDELFMLEEIAARRRPDQTRPWTDLAWRYAKNGRPSKALKAAERAIRIDDGDAVAHGVKGIALRRLGCRDAALAAYDESLRLDPQASATHSNRGYLLWLMGCDEEALVAYGKALELAEENELAYANRGQLLLVLGRRTEAVADLREAIRLGATLGPQVLLALAIRKADPAAANGLCGAALDQHGDGLTKFRRGELRAWAYLILGQADAAEAELRSAAEHHPRGEQLVMREYELLADIPGIERLLAVRREIDEAVTHDQA